MKKIISTLLCLALLLGMIPGLQIPALQASAAQVVLQPITIADSYTGESFQWYNGNGYTNTADMYIQVVEDGAEDVGALHVYQKDGVVGAEDMRLHLKTDSITPGTYVLQYNIKGSDLGNTSANDACRFYLNKDSGITSQFRNLAGTKTLANWTTLSETITTTTTSDHFILGVSKYVSGCDIYLDNVKLLDANGVDVLQGAGSFAVAGQGTSGEGSALLTLNTETPADAYALTKQEWTAMFPTGQADSGTWEAWNDNHYGEIVSQGYLDAGSLHLKSYYNKNTGVAFGAGMTPGKTYTLGLWAKGTSDSGRVLAFYANGDPVIINTSADLKADWTYYEISFTAGVGQINLVASDWGITDIYIDNITLIGEDGVDLLAGYGNFGTGQSGETSCQLATIAPTNPETAYVWFNHNGFVNNETKVLEIVEDGADDLGSIHVYQPDGKTADMDMLIAIRAEKIPAGTYTLQYKIKGSDLGNTDNNSNKFYFNGFSGLTNQFRVVAGTKSLADWTLLEETVTIDADVYYIMMMVSKYVNGADYYVDNVKILDAEGNDMLGGAGNFCVVTETKPDVTEPEVTEPEVTEPEETEPPAEGDTVPAIFHGADPNAQFQWYQGSGYTCSEDMYIEIVADGAEDVGSIHVYQKDGVVGAADMRAYLKVGTISPGTYTLQYNIKGSDLGITTTNDACRFYPNNDSGATSQFRNLAGAKSLADWTTLSETITLTKESDRFVLGISKYVCGVDFYVDNVKLIDQNGNDVLQGAGNFYRIYEAPAAPLEGVFAIDENAMVNAYEAPDGVWNPMYPSGKPDNSTWPAWDNTHFATIINQGYRDRGALNLRSAGYKNTGVAIGVNMEIGKVYTLGMWARGTSNSGRVLFSYGNGNPVIIDASTSLSEDWTYYECVFTAEMTQLNLVASDWGATDIYIDHVTLIGEDGVDLLAGYGDFCEEPYRLIDPNTLYEFQNGYGTFGQISVPGASDPTLTLTTEDTETKNGLKATWSYDGTNPAYLHRYVGTTDTWAKIFAEKAEEYPYLRMWVSNPSHVSLDLSILLGSETAQNYFSASAVKLIRKDGTEVYGGVNDYSGYGENSCISIPKQFVGWVCIPLDVANLLAVEGSSALLASFAEVTTIGLEFRKLATYGEGDSSSYYYVLDDICLSFAITGKKQSTDDNSDYSDFDTSVKGEGQVQNVIFLIGDGMGFGSLDAARLERPLYMDTIVEKGGVAGAVATTNVYGEVTDSAAGGTALATGYLTENTVLGLSANGEPIMNLGEYMQQLGKKLGLVTTTYILDATPAAFASHTNARGNYTAVAKDLLAMGVDVIQGGGRSYMNNQVMDENGKAVTLIELAQSMGYSYTTTADEMNGVADGKLLGLYGEENMPWVKEDTDTDATPSLAEMATKTIELLENESGFFVMIEGGKIDLANHSNTASDTKLEMLAFDDVVKIAMDYVDAHPGTLLIITADHETGGVRVAEDGTVTYYTTSHSDEDVPYFAYGTGAEYFENLTVNTQINYAIRRATIGDVSVGASTVVTDAQLTNIENMTATLENGIVTYTGLEQPATITVAEATAAYAIVKYKTGAKHLVGLMDDAKIHYASDNLWHISDILTLNVGGEHTFQPMGYIKGENYNSIAISGMQVQIDYVAFFDSYESAAAFQAHAALTGATPMGLNGLNMSLGDDLDMNFYVAADETAISNTTVVITVAGQEQCYLLQEDHFDSATGNYRFSMDLAAAQMTDIVTFCLMVDGQVVEKGEYTVRAYADAILNGDYDDDTKALVVAMLQYGAAAQTYFGYLTDSLANSGMEAVEGANVPDVADTEMVIVDESDDLAFYGASLIFRSKTAVRMYFTGDLSGYTFTVGDQDYSATEKDGMYYVQIDGINPYALNTPITLVATNGAETVTVTYSPMNYMVRMYGGSSESLNSLLEAMYQYHLAACKLA